jgi:hypothetical protein
MYGVRSENFCVFGFSVGSNFLAAFIGTPFKVVGDLVIHAVNL